MRLDHTGVRLSSSVVDLTAARRDTDPALYSGTDSQPRRDHGWRLPRTFALVNPPGVLVWTVSRLILRIAPPLALIKDLMR